MLVDVPGRASTVVATVAVIAVTEYVPKAPSNDPVIPSTVVCYCSVVPDSGLR